MIIKKLENSKKLKKNTKLKIKKNPNISVANPGIIKNNAPIAIAAPEIISYAGNSFFTNCAKPDLKVFSPSYLAYMIPIKAVIKMSTIVLNAPIFAPILMKR